MDDKNLEILMKKRTEEIKKNRETTEYKETVENVDEEKVCVENDTVNQTIKSINKVQRRSVFWKLLVVALIIGVNVLLFMNMDLKSKVGDLELEVLSLLDGGRSYTYLDQKIPAESLIHVDNRSLIDVDFVIASIDASIHYSNSGTRVYIPLESLDFNLETKEVTDYVKDNIVDINIPILVKNNKNYIDFEVFKKLYNLELITATDGSFAIYNQAYSQLRTIKSDIEFVKTSHGLRVVSDADPKLISSIVLDTHEKMSKIITANGRIGYVNTADLQDYNLDTVDIQINTVREAHDYGEHINMTWSQIGAYKNNPDLSLDETIPGLDAISPTWFRLNINGIVLNEADFRYVKASKDKGYEVWGLFSNDFKPSWTSEMLNDPVYRRRTIAQIAFFTALYDLDGVNIDFENMYLSDKDIFTQFMAELSPILNAQNVTFSIDVTIPGGSDQWSKVYDRKKLAKHVDYMMLMAYDEYWGSSPNSGPVSSIPWVDKYIKATLELVPKDKLILGMPLYMRVWKESGGSVSSKAIGIKHLEDLLSDKDYTKVYDDENLLNYISYREDGDLYRIWVEDESALHKRITLMNKYNLPGIGTWSKEFVEMETWEYINSLLE